MLDLSEMASKALCVMWGHEWSHVIRRHKGRRYKTCSLCGEIRYLDP